MSAVRNRTLPELPGQVTTAQLPVTSAAGRAFVASAPTGLALASTAAAPTAPAVGDLWVDPGDVVIIVMAGDGSGLFNIPESAVVNLTADLAAKAPLASPAFTGFATGAFRDKGGAAYNVRAYGAVGDGVTDDTASFNALLAAAASGGTLVVPPGSYLLSARLSLRSKQRFLMDPAAALRAAPTMNGLAILYIGAGITDVLIEGGTLDGQKGLNPTGMLFGVQVYSNCSRISIRNVHIQDIPADASGGNFGDGIYIGTAAGSGLAPADVLVEDCTVERATRNAVTVTAGVRVRVADNTFRDCTGNTPGYAADVEPNAGGDPCTDIAFENNACVNNFGGINVGGASPIARVVVAGNTFLGTGDNVPDSSSNQSTGVNVGSGVSDLAVGDNVVSSFTNAYSVASPNVSITGGTVSSCRKAIQVSADGLVVTGVTFSGVWGENPVKVQGHYFQLLSCRFYDCVDTARLGALTPAVPAVAVVNFVDSWLYPVLAGNVIRDDRLTNFAATGVRLSGTPLDLATYTIAVNRFTGVGAHYSNGVVATPPGSGTGVGVFNGSDQPNPAVGSGSFLVGSATGNLLAADAASFETGVTTVTGITGCTAAQSADFALEGAHALKMTATLTGASAARVDLGNSPATVVTPGHTYTASVWVRAGTLAAGSGVTLQLYGIDAASAQQVVAANNATILAGAVGGWQRYTVTGVIPAAYQAKAFLRFRCSPASVGDTVYLDCASLVQGRGQHWQNAGSAVAEIGPNWWLVGGTTAAPQPQFFGSKGAAPVNLNVLGGTGGVAGGDGRGNATWSVSAAGVFAGSGAGLTALPAAALTGTVAAARLGAGTADATTFLRGDGTWAAPAGGVTSVAGRTGAVTLSTADVGGLGTAATHPAADFLTPTGSGAGLTNLSPAALAAGTAGISITGNAATASAAATLSGSIPESQVVGLAADLAALAPLASPAFTGTPTAPTPAASDSSTSLATTAFVRALALGATAGAHTGTWYAPGITSSTAALALNLAEAVPIVFLKPVVIDQFAVSVTAAGSAGAVIRLGVYADDGSGYPGALILDAGTVAAATTGVKSLTPVTPLTLAAGIYWLVAASQGAPTTAPTVRIVTGNMPLVGYTSSASLDTQNATSYTASGVSGALPTTWTATVTTTTNGFRVMAHVQ